MKQLSPIGMGTLYFEGFGWFGHAMSHFTSGYTAVRMPKMNNQAPPGASGISGCGLSARLLSLTRVHSWRHEWNVLINPLHSDMPYVTIAELEPYQFGARLCANR
jgi:hypothetical protein